MNWFRQRKRPSYVFAPAAMLALVSVLVSCDSGSGTKDAKAGSAAAKSSLAATDQQQFLGEQMLGAENFVEAEALFASIHEIRSKLLGPQHIKTVSTLYCLAEACAGSGHDLPEAVRRLEAFQVGFTNLYPDQVRPALADSFRILAGVYRRMNQPAAVEAANAKCEQLRARQSPMSLKPDREFLPILVGNLAWARRGRETGVQQELPGSTESEFLRDNPHIRDLLEVAKATADNLATGATRRMEVNNAVRKAQEMVFRDRPELAAILDGRLPLDEGNPLRDDPEAFLASAWKDVKKLAEGTFSPDITTVVRSRNGPFDSIPESLEEKPDMMARLTLQLKGLLLDYEARLQASLRSTTNAQIRALNQELVALQQHLNDGNPMDVQPFSPAGITEYMGQLKRAFALRKEIVQLSGSTFPEPPGVEKIAQAIPPGSALVEFLRYGREPDDRAPIEPWYGAVVLTSTGPPVWLALAKAGEIEELVKDYQEILRNGSDAPDADNQLRMVLQSLHEMVWQRPTGRSGPRHQCVRLARWRAAPAFVRNAAR